MRQSALGPVVGVVLALQGCPPAADGDVFGALRDPEVTVTDEGSGPENAAPLEPLRVGTWAESPAGAHRVMGPQAAGEAAVRYMEVVANTAGATTTSGDRVGVLRQRGDDVIIHRLGAALDPTRQAGLLVPGRVRPGMRWESALDEGGVFGQSVVGRTEEQSPLGPVVVWRLQDDSDGRVFTYAEGLGASGLAFFGESGIGLERPTTWVVPSQDQRFDSLPLAPEDLKPLVDEFGRRINVPARVPAGCTAGTEVQWTALVDDLPVLVSEMAVTCAVDNGVQLFRLCHPLSREGDVDVAARRCRVLLDQAASGTDTGTPLFRPLEFLRHARDLPLGPLYAWREGGALRELVDVRDPAGLSGLNRFELRRDGSVFGATVTDAALARGPRADPQTALTTFGPWDLAAGAPLVFGLVQKDGRVFEVRLEDTRLVSWRFVGVLPGRVSLSDTPAGAVAVGVTTDLRVHRARVVESRVVIEAMGDLPPITAAADIVTASLDPTDLRRMFINIQRPTDVVVEPEILNARVYVTTTRRDPLEVAAPATLGLSFGDWLGDIVVCWPSTGARPDTSGWTLRGAPAVARGFSADDACAVLQNDDDVDAAYVGAERALTLDLPGIGPVRLGYPAGNPWHVGVPLQGQVAPTADGGVVDIAGQRLDAEGYPLERTATGMAAGTITDRVHRDLAGDGHYAQPAFGLLVAVGSRTIIPTEPVHSYVAGITSGGVVLDEGARWLRFEPTGTTPVPAAQRDAVVGLITRGASLPPHVTALADERICVALTPFVACVDEDGTVVRAGDPFISSGDSTNGAVLWPLPGGDLLVLGTSGVVRRLDPDTMTVAVYVEGMLERLSTTAGRVIGIHTSADGATRRVVEVGDEGLTVLHDEAVDDVVALEGSLLVATRGVWRRVWK